MIVYKKLTSLASNIYYDDELIGHIERIGDMYSLEIHYMTLNLPSHRKRLIKGIIERLDQQHRNKQYKKMVMAYNLRNSKMFGNKYVEFYILD